LYPARPELAPEIATGVTNSASEFAVSIETPTAPAGVESHRTSSEA
jgi:hypothetical protein